MSVDYNVFLGPYLEVMHVPTRKTEDLCGHEVDEGVKFCPECGTAQASRFREYLSSSATMEWFYEHEDDSESLRVVNAGEKGKEFYITNLLRPDSREMSFDPKHEETVQDLSEVNIAAERAGFKREFGSVILKMEELSRHPVKLKWGLLIWADC